MYAKDRTTIQDRREMLKIKLKSLAEEAKIIRQAEKKTYGQLQRELHKHRIGIVRSVSRHTHIAYGLIKGKTLEQIERPESAPLDWEQIRKMIVKYGPTDKQVRDQVLGRCGK